MGFFSSIGGLLGGLTPIGAIGGALLGGALDGQKAKKAQQAQIAEQNRIATIAAENASRPVTTTQKVDFEGTIKDATNAGFNPLTALRATGGNITSTTTRYVAPLLSSMPSRNFTDIMSDAFSGYQSFQKGRTQKMQLGLETNLLKSQIGLNLKQIGEKIRGRDEQPLFITAYDPTGKLADFLMPNPELFEMSFSEFTSSLGVMATSFAAQNNITMAEAEDILTSMYENRQNNIALKQPKTNLIQIKPEVSSSSSVFDRTMHGLNTGQWFFPEKNTTTKPNYNERIRGTSMKALGY